MDPRSWTDIQSIVIDGTLTLTKLVRGGRQSAIFETTDPESGTLPSYFVQLVRAADASEAEQILKRLEEARFLDHPGLLKPIGIGTIDAENLVYSVSARPLSVLAEAPGPMPVAEAHLLTVELASALSYLHAENLVFCNVRPEAVWKTENGWVLSDFSQLRLIGRSDTHELRRALVRFGDIPPEAYQGSVSPEWDVWSLGMLLQRAFTGDPGGSNGEAPPVSRARQLRAGLPEPFQRIVCECLEPNPNARPSLERVLTLLNSPQSEDAPASLPQPAAAIIPAVPPAEPAPQFVDWPPRHRLALDEPALPSFWQRLTTSFFQTSHMSWVLIFIVGVLGVAIWTFALTQKTVPTTRPAQVAAVSSESDRTNPRLSPPAPAASSVDQGTRPADPRVRDLLDRWVATTRVKDLNGQLELYAPTVDTFYNQHHVSRSHIASLRKREFHSIGQVKKFSASNIQITQIDSSNAVILFDKSWAYGSNASHTGSSRGQLTLRKSGGEWKILAERELKSPNS